MESDDDILDGPVGGPDELRSIVARAGRHRRHSLILAASVAGAAALLAGAGLGYAVSNHGSRPQTVVSATQPPGPSSPSGAAGSTQPRAQTEPAAGRASSGGVLLPAGGNLTLVFTRTAGTVEIRGYEPPTPAPTKGVACAVRLDSFQAEVSTAKVAGVAVAFAPSPPSASTAAIYSVSAQRLGQPEGAPVDVVMVHTSGAVTEVSAQFSDGARTTDEMAPVQGWSVLVATPPGPVGSTGTSPVAVASVTARGAGGGVLAQESADLGGMVALPQVGAPTPEAQVCSCAVSGAAGSGSGSASAGSGSSGSAGSSSVSAGSVSVGSVSVGSVSGGSKPTGSGSTPSARVICEENPPTGSGTQPPQPAPPTSAPANAHAG